ncbi:MAG: ATP-binding cassette domain-containing protein [Ktedonobacterales bacterium]
MRSTTTGALTTRGRAALDAYTEPLGHLLRGRALWNVAEVVTVQHLVKRYGHLIAVNDVSFSIREGEIFGIIGPNGAGKTTTVECISGLRAPDSGSISVYGLSPQKDRNKIRELVGVQLQESALPPRLKVGEAARLFAANPHLDVASTAQELVTLFDRATCNE